MEEKTRQAFKVTMKKLDKLNAPVADEFKEDLERERLDQVSVAAISSFNLIRMFENFPNPFGSSLVKKTAKSPLQCVLAPLPGRHRMANKIKRT